MRNLVESTLRKRYQIERELGRGGMGAVYLAQDLHLQRPVAIKVLPPELAVRPELRERFLRETRLAAGFSHPNIVAVHAVEEHPQLLCFVMGFVEGETLGQRVRRTGPLGAAEATRMLQEVAWALSYAHGRGVVHRDIKPDNILIERATGRALVTDFGIARSTSAGATSLTQVGEVVGTPQFMSPEQAAGEALDGRSDLYSLGVVGFFAVTGRLPFDAPGAGAVMAMHLTQAPPRVAALRPDLPGPLCAAIDRCLEKDPAKRFESGEALATALDAMRSSRREVAPAVRMFQLQANQAVRALVVMVLLASTMLMNVSAEDSAARLLVGIVAWSVFCGIAAQLAGRARYLLTLGFGFEDVRDGLALIQLERAEAREQERANPRARRREDLRTRLMASSFILSIAGNWFVLKFLRVKSGAHSYRVGVPGLLIGTACAVLFGLAIALLMMNPGRATGLDRLLTRLWSGWVGRTVFRIAGWRLEHDGTAAPSGASGAATPLALIAALPGGARRQLGDARDRIERLERTIRALGDRERELEGAISDAGGAALTGDAALRARRDELVSGLAAARVEAAARRERLGSALENVRLQLVRVKSGVGSAADVTQELRAAEELSGG